MKIIGHRGAKALAPENTLLSFQKALDHGVTEIETDVHITKDKVIVLVHDPKMHDGAGGSYTVADHTYKELLGYNANLATLKQALALVNRQVPFMIELKPGVPVEPVLDHIRALHKQGWQMPDITIASESYASLKAIRAQMPELTLSVVESWSGVRATWRARKLGIKRLSMNHWSLWSGYTKPLARRGYQISAYTVNRPRTARRMQRIGVAAIFTDNPDILKQ